MPFPSAGGAVLRTNSGIAIRFLRKGCANRPFFHVVIQNYSMDPQQQCIEQIGTYDPMPNIDNQKLLGLNIERLEYWLGRGATPSRSVAQLLGLVGLYPIHPETTKIAWTNRKTIAAEIAKLKAEKEKESASPDTNTTT